MDQIKVRDIMTTEVVTVGADETLEEAEQIMRAGRIHHLPVMRGEHMVGVVTQADVLRAQVSQFAEFSPTEELDMMSSIPVTMIMSDAVDSVDPDTSAMEAARILRRHKYGCLPVLDAHDKVVGIVTEGDFVSLAIRALDSQASRRVATVSPRRATSQVTATP